MVIQYQVASPEIIYMQVTLYGLHRLIVMYLGIYVTTILNKDYASERNKNGFGEGLEGGNGRKK